MMNQKYLTVLQIAELLGLTKQDIHHHIDKGHLKATRFGNVYAILASDFENFKQNRRPVGRPKKASAQR